MWLATVLSSVLCDVVNSEITVLTVLFILLDDVHRLRGSASTVLTATGKSMGDGEF